MIDIKPYIPTIGVALLVIALFFLLRGKLSALEDRVDKHHAKAQAQGFAPLAAAPACSPAAPQLTDPFGGGGGGGGAQQDGNDSSANQEEEALLQDADDGDADSDDDAADE